MKWNEFCTKLREAKKAKKNKGLSVPVIATLLFGGAMDSMLEPGEVAGVDTYKRMYEDVKAALGSKANLAKKKKTEMLGLIDVDGAVPLSLWRHQMNPLATFDIITTCKEDLKVYGFIDTNHPAYPMKRKASDNYKSPALLTPYWGKVFQNKMALDAFEAGEYELAILGIITEATIKPYADGDKERLCFRLFTGTEYTDEITVWPTASGKIASQIRDSVKPMEIGFAVVRPKTWNGRPGATLLRWQKLIRTRS